MSDKRKCEVLFGNNWIEVSFRTLQSGNLFRLFDGDVPVRGSTGNTQFEAVSDAYERDGVWTVDVGI